MGGATMVTVEAPAALRLPAPPGPSIDNSGPGGEVVVTIAAANYGGRGVTETLPTGFAYVSSSLEREARSPKRPDCQVHPPGGDTSFTYTVTASSTPVPYDFLRYAEGLR